MADKQLTSNVNVDGVWYGPSYPNNTPTSAVLEKITNPAAFADTQPPAADLRMTAADFGVEEGEQPSLRTRDTFAFSVPPAPVEAEDRKHPVPENVPSVADVASGPEGADSGGSTRSRSRRSGSDTTSG